MKASTESDEHELEFRNERLNRALLQTHAKTTEEAEVLCSLPLATKEKLFFEELERQQRDEYWREFRNSLLNQRRLIDAGFPHFCQLPKELRVQIWEHATEEDSQPRTHIITKRNGRYISNQRISALLSICSESRIVYLESGAEAAFGTYIHFDTAVIYIRPFPDRQGEGPCYVDATGHTQHFFQLFEDEASVIEINRAARDANRAMFSMDTSEEELDEEEEFDWQAVGNEVYATGAELTFNDFLDDDSARKIKHLAMTIELFNNSPMTGTLRECHYTMRKKMPVWQETLLVFDDRRQQTTAWENVGSLFRDSCPADKMRRNHLIGGITKRIRHMTLPEEARDKFEPMVHRYVFVEDGEVGGNKVPGSEVEIDSLIAKLRECLVSI